MIYSSKILNFNINQDLFEFRFINIEIKIWVSLLQWFLQDVIIIITLYGIEQNK